LFLDDLNNFPDIFYYKKQFWGENDKYKINPIDGVSLLSKPTDYSYEIEQYVSKVKDVIIIEWDLAIKPFQGSIVNAYGSQIIIPDQNNRLFHDLKPFDLCFCQKNPIKIEANIIKMVNVIKKCSFSEAIEGVSNGMDYLEGYYPLSLVTAVLKKRINPFNAYEAVLSNPNKTLIPNYSKFIKAFQSFLFDFIKKEKDYVFNELKSNPKEYSNQILTLLNLSTELLGLKLPYTKFIENLIKEDITRKELKIQILDQIHQYISNDLNNPQLGTTKVYNLKKMRNTPFIKYSKRIVEIRKNEFEESLIFKHDNQDNKWYDLSEINKTYYGKKFLKILEIKTPSRVNKDELKKFENLALKIGIQLKIIDWKR